MTTPTPTRMGHPTAAQIPRRPLRDEPSAVAMLPEKTVTAAWRYRWQLAPIAGGVGVLACAQTAPGILIGPLIAAGAGLELWRRKAWTIKGRKVMSAREKGHAVTWMAGALAATAPAALIPAAADVILAAAALSWPSYQLAASRLPRRVKLSPAAQAYLTLWDRQIAIYGPEPVQASAVIASTAHEPSPGAVAFEVRLPERIHGKAASTDAVRQQIERDLHLPVDTLRLVPVRDDSGRLEVLITPTRHLETNVVPWPGPIWKNGTTLLATALNGAEAWVALNDDAGIRHALISGTTGAGKSRALRGLALPETVAGHGILILLDGGGGTSCPDLAPAAKIYAVEPDEWRHAIRQVYATYLIRKLRRGRAGLTKFIVGQDEPTITLAVDEAGAVNKALSASEQDMVLEMLQQGRKLGLRIIQCVQDPMADEIIGGRKGRGLLTGGGITVALRAGDGMASRLTLGSNGTTEIDLTTLPDAPGASWLLERGRIVTGHPVRLVDAHEEAVTTAVRDLELVELPADEEPTLMEPMQEAFTEPTEAEMRDTDAALIDILRDGPRKLGEIEDDERWTFARKTASNRLTRRPDLFTKDGADWSLVETSRSA